MDRQTPDGRRQRQAATLKHMHALLADARSMQARSRTLLRASRALIARSQRLLAGKRGRQDHDAAGAHATPKRLGESRS